MTIISDKEPKKFKHIDLRLVVPSFDAPLMDLIIELDFLRKKTPIGSTPPATFLQIKSIFHLLESIGSARIEGNNTTVQEYVETKLDPKPDARENIKEIRNMEMALQFIDANVGNSPIDRAFISELHKLVVIDLQKEGSSSPGTYRNINVEIRGSDHVSPPHELVEKYMGELIEFINKDDPHKYDLIKTALAHHRFVWIHPFDNGNGRTVRLVTYAMLVKQGFNLREVERVINPAAVFCHDRKEYYGFLSAADRGDNEGALAWTNYMLAGLKREIEKIDLLVDYKYLSEKILIPAIDYSLERKLVTAVEGQILKIAVEKKEFMNADIKPLFPTKDISEVSKMIGKLKEKKMLQPVQGRQRIYSIVFDNNFLLRGIIDALHKNNFLPIN